MGRVLLSGVWRDPADVLALLDGLATVDKPEPEPPIDDDEAVSDVECPV